MHISNHGDDKQRGLCRAGAFLSAKLLFQMFLDCLSPRASPLGPPPGPAPPNPRSVTPKLREMAQRGLEGARAFPARDFTCSHPPAPLCVLCQTRASPTQRAFRASSRVSSQGLGESRWRDAARPCGSSWGEFPVHLSWKPFGEIDHWGHYKGFSSSKVSRLSVKDQLAIIKILWAIQSVTII